MVEFEGRARMGGGLAPYVAVKSKPEAVERFFAGYLASLLPAVHFLRPQADAIAAPSLPSGESPSLREDGSGTASVLGFLTGAHRDRFEAIVEDLRRVVPQVRDLRVLPARIEASHRERLRIRDQDFDLPLAQAQWGQKFELRFDEAGWLPAASGSGGTLAVLALLTALHARASGPALLLLDDLDRALQPRAQEEMVDRIRRHLEANPQLQVIATTHFPYLIDHFAYDEIRVMDLDDRGHGVCRSLADHPDIERWKDVMAPGEFWSSVGESWLSERTLEPREE